jgi:hypothetical protein
MYIALFALLVVPSGGMLIVGIERAKFSPVATGVLLLLGTLLF